MSNNPLRYSDPTGHMQSCEDGDACRSPNTTLDPSSGNGQGHRGDHNGEGTGSRCSNNPDCLKMDDDVIVPDCWHSTTCRQEWANNVGAFATLLDLTAAGLNAGYLLVGSAVIAVCIGCAPGVLGVYQFYSAIPNSVSTGAGLLWIGQGILTGETL